MQARAASWTTSVGLAAVAAVALARSAAAATPPGYTVVPAESTLVVDVFKSGPLSGVAHDHHLYAGEWSGSFAFDPARPSALRGTIVVRAASLHDRQPKLSADDERKVDARAHGPDVLDAARYPTIELDVDRFEPSASGNAADTARGTLVGRLTLHGRTREIRVPCAATFREGAAHVVGRTAFDQSAFGIEPYSTALGTIGVKDRVVVRFDVVATTAAR